MVTMMLIEPKSDETISRNMPISQAVWPVVAMTASGAYDVHPDLTLHRRDEEARQHDDARREVEPVAPHVERGERHVRRADLQRHQIVAEAADGQRHDGQKHHDGAVHRPELVVELGQHRSRIRPGQLPSHKQDQQETDQQEGETRPPVLQPDDLVIRGKHAHRNGRDSILLAMSASPTDPPELHAGESDLSRTYIRVLLVEVIVITGLFWLRPVFRIAAMHWIDWTIVALYLIWIVWTGLSLGRRNDQLEGYFLANRSCRGGPSVCR